MSDNLAEYTKRGWMFLFTRASESVLLCIAIKDNIVHTGLGDDMITAFSAVERKIFFPGEPPNE